MRDATICEEELLQNIQVYTIGTIGIVGTVVEYCIQNKYSVFWIRDLLVVSVGCIYTFYQIT